MRYIMIIQNKFKVPTSRDIHLEIAKFLRGELETSNTNYLRQNNHKEIMWSDPLGKQNNSTIEDFL